MQSDGEGHGRSTAVARAIYGVIAALVAISIVIQLILLFAGGTDANSGASGAGVPLGIRLWRFLSYFTIDSNIVVLVTSVLLTADPRRRGRVWDIIRLNALLAITITGIVYAVVLAPMLHLSGWALVATIGLHYVSPWATVAAWLVLGPRRRIAWSTILGAFVLPVGWLVYTFLTGSITHWYPYPFLDVGERGLARAILNGGLVLALAFVLALIVTLVDSRVPSLVRNRREP